MPDVAIIGTCHSYQRGQIDAEAFEQMVESYASAYSFAAIAEEMSRDALAEHGLKQSICERVADRRHLDHSYVDPDGPMRTTLGIEPTMNVDWAGMKGCPYSRQEIEQHNWNRNFHPREKYWLERLHKFDRWPVLFVCGADHVESFAAKVKGAGRSYVILEFDWPEPTARESPGR